MELISREEAINRIEEAFDMGDCYCDKFALRGILKSLPTVEERKEGEWVRITQDPGLGPHQYMCSECHRIIEYDSSGIPDFLEMRYPYCHCGARMKVSKR